MLNQKACSAGLGWAVLCWEGQEKPNVSGGLEGSTRQQWGMFTSTINNPLSTRIKRPVGERRKEK